MLTYINKPLTKWESQPSLAQVCSLTSTNLGITGWEEDLGGSLSADIQSDIRASIHLNVAPAEDPNAWAHPNT